MAKAVADAKAELLGDAATEYNTLGKLEDKIQALDVKATKAHTEVVAKASLNMGDTDSVVIPDAAVVKQQGSGQKLVYVLKADSTVEARIITLGRFSDGKYEVLSGLSEGEVVVVKGQSVLKSGDKVEVVK